MKVFISWSGDTSRSIAEILRNWLPSVIQALKPYYSPDDISKGSRWSTEISKELEDCKVGLLCLTADNVEAPWIMFEAGALSKSLSSARVCPLLFGIEPSDIKGPLVQFQAAPFSRDEMKKAVRMMNQELGATALASDVLDSVFDMWWPRLEESIEKVIAAGPNAKKHVVRTERDILEEILARVRATPAATSAASSGVALLDLSEKFNRLQDGLAHLPDDSKGEIGELVDAMKSPLDYMLRRTAIPGGGMQIRRERALRTRSIPSEELTSNPVRRAIPVPPTDGEPE